VDGRDRRATGRWRVGRKVGRTIYRQIYQQPSDADPLIGVMDTPELAARVVASVNRDWLDGLRQPPSEPKRSRKGAK
jgi:hypothetical protein